jgi:prepilin-type N-terminal cleavage/methylation domain-containing protein
MKKIKKAFSLIELIIVSSILVIVSSSGVIYFTDFIDNLALKKTISIIWNNFETLDKKIDRKEIFDYELYLSGWTNYYTSSENIFDSDVSIEISSLNLDNWIWEIKFNRASSWTGVIKYYKGYKFKKLEQLNYNWSFTGNFLDPFSYKIEWSFSWKTVNSINFNYFDDKKLIRLVKIDTNKDNNIDSIVIKNILWKKTFWNDNVNKITLTFENNLWKVKTLELNR